MYGPGHRRRRINFQSGPILRPIAIEEAERALRLNSFTTIHRSIDQLAAFGSDL